LVDWSDILFRNGRVVNAAMYRLNQHKLPIFVHFNGGTWQTQTPGENIMPVFIQQMTDSRISARPLTLDCKTQLLTKNCFPRMQYHRIVHANRETLILSPISRIFYINLDRRKDRLQQIQQELFAYGLLPLSERFSAIDRSENGGGKGIVGCTMSHLAVLREARLRKYSSVLIFEDDFSFCVSKDVFLENIRRLYDSCVDFQVCMLSYKLDDSRDVPRFPFLHKVLSAQSASGYIVHHSMFDQLISLYEWALPLLEETDEHWNYANDQVWKVLQQNDSIHWYAFSERIGKQRCGYSDNSENYMDYDC